MGQPRSQGLSSLPPLSFLNDNGGREERPWERGWSWDILSINILSIIVSSIKMMLDPIQYHSQGLLSRQPQGVGLWKTLGTSYDHWCGQKVSSQVSCLSCLWRGSQPYTSRRGPEANWRKRAKTRTTTKSEPKKAIKQIRQAKKLEIAAVFKPVSLDAPWSPLTAILQNTLHFVDHHLQHLEHK